MPYPETLELTNSETYKIGNLFERDLHQKLVRRDEEFPGIFNE